MRSRVCIWIMCATCAYVLPTIFSYPSYVVCVCSEWVHAACAVCVCGCAACVASLNLRVYVCSVCVFAGYVCVCAVCCVTCGSCVLCVCVCLLHMCAFCVRYVSTCAYVVAVYKHVVGRAHFQCVDVWLCIATVPCNLMLRYVVSLCAHQ